MRVIIIAHNQFALLQNEIKALELFGKIQKQDVVIVDNASEDGLRQWLEEQTEWNYLVCDEGIEGYAAIVNAAIREFDIHEDVLILTPNYLPMPRALEEMQRQLYSNEHIGAVSAALIPNGCEYGKDYNMALNYVQGKEKEAAECRQILGVENELLLIKSSMIEDIGAFDEKLRLPISGMMDFLLRGILQGYECYECRNAYFFAVNKNEISPEWGEEVDRATLKVKWNMNYFGILPNVNMVNLIKEQEQREDISVLEIGCDIGSTMLEIKHYFPKVELYGAELNPRSAEIASCFANVQVANIEAEDIDFGEKKFDYIIFGDVLEHLHNPEKTVHYCRSLLKENGHILASIPNVMHYSVMRGLLQGNFTYTDIGLLDRTHIHFFTYKEIIRMFGRANFSVERISGTELPSTNGEDREFVKGLMALSEGVEENMFYTYQYVLSARMN